jgi:hypothetical protein
LVLAIAVRCADAQTPRSRVILGTVSDTAGRPIPYANISVGQARSGVADDSGRFRVAARVNVGLTLDVRRIGFQPGRVQIAAGGDTSIAVVLFPVAQALPATVIADKSTSRSLDLSGFYRRLQDREKGINAGHFFTAEDIEGRKANRVTQMLEGVAGVRIVPSGIFFVALGSNGCTMTVYLDRIRLNRLGGQGPPVLLDELVSPRAVAGIEVYTSPLRTPPEYQSLNGLCGSILVWTR